MKKRAHLFLCILLINFWHCAPSQNKDFKSLITKVPITELPAGIAGLDTLDSLMFDYLNPNRMEQLVSYDSINKFGLNDFFEFDDMKAVNANEILDYSLLTIQKTFFAQRLPKIDDKEVLIFYVIRSRPVTQPDFPTWILAITDENGAVSENYILAGLDCKDNDFITKFLFAIDNDYNLTIKDFRRIDDEESEDEASPTHNPHYLYPIASFKYQLNQ